MYKIGILWHIVDLSCGRKVVNFFSIMVHWTLNLSEPHKVRKEENVGFHQHQQ